MKINFSSLFLKALLIAFVCIVSLGGIALADVSPGDIIDKTNWEKAKGLLPESVLNWVKKGDWKLNVSEMKEDISTYYQDYMKEYLEKNKGKYDFDLEKGIIELPGRNEVTFLPGIPFPEVDKNDPNAGYKVLYNLVYGRQGGDGNINFSLHFIWVGRSGFEREVYGKYVTVPYTAYPPHRSLENPKRLMAKNILAITSPYDIAGTAVMLWRFSGQTPDMNFSYVPAIRRCRRMSPASRSDAFLGSDFALDDTAGFDGKILSFEVKLLRVQDALVPFLSVEPYLLDEEPGGGLVISPNNKLVKFGYQEDGWTGAPWAMTNSVWVKKKVYVLELHSRDPYYNYGKQELWTTVDRFASCYKVIDDRAGAYWKTVVTSLMLASDRDKTFNNLTYGNMVLVDDRSDHATISEQMSPNPETSFRFKQKLRLDDFSIAGFQKYCK
jgi:Protein of unknown function (DUF1329)